jgi:hypothetical protein
MHAREQTATFLMSWQPDVANVIGGAITTVPK